jgi:hypothetical protein
MIINDLPKYVKQTALLRQHEQGNNFNPTLKLDKEKSEGNFHWADSKEGEDIWEIIWNNRDYNKFCLFHRITKGELNENNPKYIQLITSAGFQPLLTKPVTPDAAFPKQNKLLNKNFY